MLQPPGSEITGLRGERYVCLLKKSLYGLKQAARAWNEALTETLDKLGYRRCDSEPSLYIHKETPYLYVLVYVDDLLLVGLLHLLAETKRGLQAYFRVTDLGPALWFLGFEIRRMREMRRVTLTQRRYAREILEKFGMGDCKPAATPLPAGFKFHAADPANQAPADVQLYQSAVGSLMYLVTGTRPDLAFAVGAASKFMQCPNQLQWQGVKHILRYLQGTRCSQLTLGSSDSDAGDDHVLTGFCDADWGANDESKRSISGYVFFYGHGPISWSSKRQKTVALSSTEAEYMALTRASGEALWLQYLSAELLRTTPGPTTIHVDNRSCIALAKNPEGHERTKHIDIKFHFIRHHVSLGRINLEYCPTELMTADVLTKPLTRVRHAENCQRLQLTLVTQEGEGDEEKKSTEDAANA
jgi:hypothetical protein